MSAVAGGFAGALVLMLALESAVHARLTRLDLLLVLGTLAPLGAAAARAAGFAIHLATGMAAALAYPPALDALSWDRWWHGAVLGAGHGAVAVAVVGVVLPAAHPRLRARGGGTVLEAPGALLQRYGTLSAPILVAAHVLYGAVVGGFVSAG